MRKSMLTILLLAFIVVAKSQNYTGDSWAQVKTNGQGTIALAYVETPELVYKDNAGKLTGICVDIMNDFVNYVNTKKGVKLGSKFVGDGTSFKGMYDKVKGSIGGVFGLGNITITEERKKEIKFSPPYMTNLVFLITQSNVPTLAKMEDMGTTFANLTAYTAKGTLNEKRTLELKQKYFPNMKIAYTSISQETYEKVVSDPNGFAYLDIAFYLEAVQQRKPVTRHPVGDKTAEQFGFIMPLNSDWGPILDEFFKAEGGYLNSPGYKSILKKHLGEIGVKLLQGGK